jgi:hypothetical protein
VSASPHLNEETKSRINQYSEDVPLRPSTKQHEVKTNMNKFISLIVISLMLFGFGILPLSDYSLIGFIPILGITLRRKKNDDPQLPEPYVGIREGYSNKDDYVKERISLIDKDTLYSNKVEDETRQAEEQWHRRNPDFEKLQSLIADNNYCDLVGVYNTRVYLRYPDAFYQVFNLIIREKGTLIGDNQYSIDMTIGEFLHYVVEELCLDCYFNQKRHMLTAVLKLRDQYGVKFNTPEQVSPPAETSIEIEGGIIDFDDEEMLDDIDLLDVDYDDDEDNDEDEISSLDETLESLQPAKTVTERIEVRPTGVPITVWGTKARIVDDVNPSSSRNPQSSNLNISEEKIPEKEDKTFDPKDPSTWNEKHKLNAERCVANDPRCATCEDRS